MPYNSGVSQNGSIGLYTFDASTRQRASHIIIIMPRSLKPRNVPCPVQGCRFLATGGRGLSLHSRIHRDELRALRRRENAWRREQRETGNSDDIGDNDSNSAADDNASFHEDHEDQSIDGHANVNEDDHRQLPNNSNKTRLSGAEYIEYHPHINGM